MDDALAWAYSSPLAACTVQSTAWASDSGPRPFTSADSLAIHVFHRKEVDAVGLVGIEALTTLDAEAGRPSTSR